MTRSQFSWIGFVVLSAIGTIGCGGGSPHSMASAGGVVRLDGKPVPGVVVTLHPQMKDSAEGGKSATGITDENGKFQLSTYEINDGAIIGTHQVAIGMDGPENPPGKLPKDFTLEVTSGNNQFEIDLEP